MKTQVILLGAPGSGKGTQSNNLKAKGFKHVSTGDLLRDEIKKGTDLGKRVSDLLADGQLVDDDTVLELLQANIDLDKNSYIFDGYPRNIVQAKILCEELLLNSKAVAIFFKIDVDTLVERVVNRRICKSCNAIYSVTTKPSKKEGICDLCGGDVIQRRDDTKDVVLNRMSIFEESTRPVLEFFKGKGKLHELTATKGSDVIEKEIDSILEL